MYIKPKNEDSLSYLECLFEFGTHCYDDLEEHELDKVSSMVIKEMDEVSRSDYFDYLINNRMDFIHNIIGLMMNDKYSNSEKNKNYSKFIIEDVKESARELVKTQIEGYFNFIKSEKGFNGCPEEDIEGDNYQYSLSLYKQKFEQTERDI